MAEEIEPEDWTDMEWLILMAVLGVLINMGIYGSGLVAQGERSVVMLILAEMPEGYDDTREPAKVRLPRLQGNCGHFVRYVGYQRYYNGHFDCARTLYECTLCGPGKIEHV